MEKEEKMLLCRLEAPSVMCYGTIRARVVPSVTEVKTGDTLFAALASHSKKIIALKCCSWIDKSGYIFICY